MEKVQQEDPKYFDEYEIGQLRDLVHQQVAEINYYHWINKTDASQIVTMLDVVEFLFIDNTRICFCCSELCDAIEIRDFNFDAANAALFQKFEGDLFLRKTGKTHEPLWQQIIQAEIAEVLLDSDGANHFFSDRVMLKFGREIISILITSTGLNVKLG